MSKQNETKNFVISVALLKLASRCVVVSQALEMLPSTIEVREVYDFLLNVLEEKEAKRRNCQVLKSLLFAEHLQVSPAKTFLKGISAEKVF